MRDKFNYFVPEDKTKCEYIGFNLDKPKSPFIFPCQYFDESELDEREKERLYKKEAKDIIMLLKRIQQEYHFGGSKGELAQFHSMIWLMQDFVDRGYYIETEHIYKNSGTGKINWKRTVKQGNILFNNGNIVYTSFVRNRVTVDESRIITQIYKACLSYSVENLGFIYGLTDTERSVYDVVRDKDFIVYYLTGELINTNRDYKKTLLNHLLSIVNNHSKRTKNLGYSIYDEEFEYVFERLVNSVFGTESVKDFYNTYSYYLPDKVPSSKLRPDTIMKDEKNSIYYIVDSKYYNYGYTYDVRDLPASSSISKQIGYNLYLRENMPDKDKKLNYRVKSVFVLPYASTKPGEYVKYIGYAKRDADGRGKPENKDDRVAVCLIDLKELIHTYIYNHGNLTAEKLIGVIPQ